MRIGMILDAPFPDDARVSNECDELIKRGHEIFLFCLSYKQKFLKEEVYDGINIRRYFCSKLVYKSSALANDLPFYNMNMAKKIRHFVKNNQTDYLHIHDIQIAGAAIQICDELGLQFTLDLHENRPEIMKHYKHVNSFFGKLLINPNSWKIAEEKFIKKAHKVITVTKEAKKELLKRCMINAKKIVVYPNTVKKSFYLNKNINQKISADYSKKFVLLYIGNTSERRGLETVIDALPLLKDKILNIKLVIIGQSSFDKKLRSKVKKLKLSNFVDFMGWKKENELYKYLMIAHLGISPLHRNIHHDTTYANKLFQYISFGVPVICSNSTAQSELISNYKCGKVFEERNSKDFEKKVLSVFNDKREYNLLKTNCLSAIKKLNNSVISKELVSIYE